MKSALWRTLAVLAIVAMPNMAAANDATIGSEAAHSSMVGSTLNNTTALFNAWPHLVTQNGNGAEIVSQNLVFGGPDGGRARVWAEMYDGLWVNLQVGRTDLGGQAANFMWGGTRMGDFFAPWGFNNPNTTENPLRSPWFNLGIAKPTSNGGAWAANVLFASETSSEDATDPATSDGGSAFGGLFSWGNGDGLNLSGEFTTQSDKLDTGDAASTTEATFTNFSLNGRFDSDLYIYQGSFVMGSGSFKTDPGDADQSIMGFLGSAGRFLKNEVDGQTSIEFIASFVSVKDDDGTAEDTTSNIVFPGIRVAAWEKITDRVGLMGGVSSSYVLAKDEDNDGTDPDPDSDEGSKGLSYDWQAGIFCQFTDNVRVDFQLVKDNLGQTLSLGNEEPLVYYIGATVGLN